MSEHAIAVEDTELREAVDRLRGRIRRTPVLELAAGDVERLSLKLENLQLSGSFKIRGAMNRILADKGAHDRVVAASGGNHGVAVARTCRALGLEVDVFVPASSPPEKTGRMTMLGARVHVVDAPFTEVEQQCTEYGREIGALFVHPFNDAAVIAGQGTLGLEMVEQIPDLRTVYVSVGGGGLAAGLARSLPESVHIVAVEPEACASLTAALAAGRPVPTPVGGVAADSLGAPIVGDRAFATLRPRVRPTLTVTGSPTTAKVTSGPTRTCRIPTATGC